ncbi:MAG: hypothetical protein L0H70_08885 [Xanthomonadales bacterium]|nr:hypothetical protein [Xanthomonadales bacterium]
MDSSTMLGIMFLVAGALVTLFEIQTVTIYLLVLGIGLFAAGALMLVGAGLTASLALLAIILLFGLPIAHWWRGKLKNRAADIITDDDVGHHVTVVEVNGAALRVDYRGTTWNARLDSAVTSSPVNGDQFVIVRREGNVLILAV